MSNFRGPGANSSGNNPAAQANAAHSQEQSLRSVFVGNIAYSVTEEQITDLFSTIGPIVKFRLVRDRDTGRPKGFGFCEYQDVATAEAAIRNLNNYEIEGRNLKVDSAVNSAADKHGPDEFLTQTCTIEGGPEQFDDDEPVYGPTVLPEHAVEAVTNVVTSFPPEKMFEVMREMKELTKTDPGMVKAMLDTNPQLSFALLQLLIIMRTLDPRDAVTLDPRDAVSMLHQEAPRLDYPFYKTSADDDSQSFAPLESFNNGDNKDIKQRIATSRPVVHEPIPDQNAEEDEESTQLLIQLLQLSDAQIAMLPEEDRIKVRELQARLRNAT
uniref:RRM domain-containing protein n=1 Tax=Panagrolaimus sp. JU765 TaxID=591449 RepID=A0AC34QGS5_9BILA